MAKKLTPRPADFPARDDAQYDHEAPGSAFDDEFEAGDEEDDEDQDEPDSPDEREHEAQARQRNRGGRPVAATRTRNRPAVMSVTGVFKDETDYQSFLDEATERGLSSSAYALEVFTNRHNTSGGASELRRTNRNLRERVSQLEGAKETLQGLFEQAKAGTKPADSLAGFDDAPVTNRTLAKAVEAEIAKRDAAAAAANMPELQKRFDKLQEDYDELEEQMERDSSFMVRAQTLGPALVHGLLQKAPGLATALAGLGGFEVPGLPAGPLVDTSDPLVTAALRTRDNVSPKQARELEQVLDAVCRRPDFITRFASAVQQYEQAQATPLATV